jgi:hypothetical protein
MVDKAQAEGWNPIETAPIDEDVILEVTDRRGLPYRCSLTASGWVSSGKEALLAVTPVKWKRYGAGRVKR